MYIAYILKSESDGRYYYGYTGRDMSARLIEHNEGKSSYTKKYRPWTLVWYAAFKENEKARDFERYLKTPSGHAFARKRFIFA